MPGRIAFVSERDGNREVYLIRPSGQEERLTRSPAADYPAAVTPDGSGIVVVSVVEDSITHLEQLVLQPLSGGAGRPLGPRSPRARAPSWSPDGRWLVFQFQPNAASYSDLFRIGSDGSGLQRLTDNREGNFEPVVSPDGSQIVFASSRDGDAEVYVMRADGSEQRRLTAFHRDDWGAQWSPDGRTIAFLSAREGSDRIFLVEQDGTGMRRLNPAADTSGDARTKVLEAEFAWSPDGARIAYVRRAMGGTSRVRVTELKTGAVRELTAPEGKHHQPAWSPDGRYLVFASDHDGETDLYLARADGTGATRLTRAKGADWLPRWISAGGTPPR
jgi:TolB protein